MTKTILTLLAGAALVAGCSKEADKAGPPAAEATATATMNDAQKAYDQVNQTMHAGMAAIPADADLAFMQGMLAHHQGAVAMSEVVLKYGTDAKARDLADRVIKAQTAEIAEIEGWLKARGAAPAAPAAGMSDHGAHAQ